MNSEFSGDYSSSNCTYEMRLRGKFQNNGKAFFFFWKNKKYIQSKTVLQMITYTDKQHTATDQYSYI